MSKYLIPIICFLLIPVIIIGSLLGIDLKSPVDGGNIDGPSIMQEDPPYGIWYEQVDYGGILEITPSEIIYRWNSLDGTEYSTEAECTLREKGDQILIETREEDYFYYVDMYYDKEQDMVVGYTMPFMDGDGGYHYTEFHRTEYVAPPPPVYGPAEDLSDPDAQKVFEDLTIRHMTTSFYDDGPYHDPYSDMAQEPPYPDYYSYDLTVLEDGSALVSSSFCQEIDIPKEVVDELQELIRTYDLGSINGLNIHTPDLPYDAADYEVELELASGEIIRSSANGSDVPENWSAFQEDMHYLLFFAFVDAGYKLNGDFHSSKPMKRIGVPEEDQVYPDISYESVVIVPDWEKSFDYSLDTEYPVFSGDSEQWPELMATLQELSDQYKEMAETDLQKDYEAMEAVPASIWKSEDRRFCYSFYAVEYSHCYGSIYSFFLSEGHCNSLGAGEHGYGDYPNHLVNINMKTGELLALSDLFTDPDTACETVVELMRDSYSDYSEAGRYILSDEFPVALRKFIDKSEPEGGPYWSIGYDGITVSFPKALFPMDEYTRQHTFYYDELQDVLSDEYATVW